MEKFWPPRFQSVFMHLINDISISLGLHTYHYAFGWTWLLSVPALHQSYFADSRNVLKVGILGITETAVYFWAVPQMSIQGGQKCVIGGPYDEAQSCLWNLPHVGPSYGLVGDCFPGCPPSLPPLAHSFDPEWLILHSDDFRDHQLLPFFLCGLWAHLWGRCPLQPYLVFLQPPNYLLML